MILDTFQHNGTTLQIRLHDAGDRIILRATDTTGTAVNGYEYSVAKLDQIDATVAATLDPLKELAKVARGDVESDVWQQYVDAVRALKSGEMADSGAQGNQEVAPPAVGADRPLGKKGG